MLAIRKIGATNVYRAIVTTIPCDSKYKSFKYRKGSVKETVAERENRKYWDSRQSSLRKAYGDRLPKGYYQKRAQMAEEQSMWENMTAEERESLNEIDRGKMEKFDTRRDWIASKRSNLKRPSTKFTLPGLDSNILIGCSGAGDSKDFIQKTNEEYHQYENIEIFMKKFDQSVGSRVKTKTGKKNQKLKRPSLTIYPIEANPSYSQITVDSLNIDDRLKTGLTEMGITKLSKVQSLMLDRYYSHDGDIMAVSETGSGKTLAYLLIALGRF